MGKLFERCPALHGFTVLDRSLVPGRHARRRARARPVRRRHRHLPGAGARPVRAIYDEISVALLDFMLKRPEAREVLRGRTFARAFH